MPSGLRLPAIKPQYTCPIPTIHSSNPYHSNGPNHPSLVFVSSAAGLGVSVIRSGLLPQDNLALTVGVFVGIIVLCFATISLDIIVRRKRIETISAVFLAC